MPTLEKSKQRHNRCALIQKGNKLTLSRLNPLKVIIYSYLQLCDLHPSLRAACKVGGCFPTSGMRKWTCRKVM